MSAAEQPRSASEQATDGVQMAPADLTPMGTPRKEEDEHEHENENEGTTQEEEYGEVEAEAKDIIKHAVAMHNNRVDNMSSMAEAVRERYQKRRIAQETLKTSPGSFTPATTSAAAANYLADKHAKESAGQLLDQFRKPAGQTYKLKPSGSPEKSPGSPIVDMIYSTPNTPAKEKLEPQRGRKLKGEKRTGKLHQLQRLLRDSRVIEQVATYGSALAIGSTIGMWAFRKVFRMESKPVAATNARWYTVTSGDTIWGISGRVIGDSTRMHEIIELNPKRFANEESVHLIFAGEQIATPPPYSEEPAAAATKSRATIQAPRFMRPVPRS